MRQRMKIFFASNQRETLMFLFFVGVTITFMGALFLENTLLLIPSLVLSVFFLELRFNKPDADSQTVMKWLAALYGAIAGFIIVMHF